MSEVTEEKIAPDGEVISSKHTSLISALAAAQLEFVAIEMDKENSHFNSKYASLAAVIKATRPALNRHGLVCWGRPTSMPNGDPAWETILEHESGSKINSVLPIFFGNTMQSLGSALTYAKRQGRCGILDVCGEDDDDDGSAAGTAPERRKEQKQENRSDKKQSQNSNGNKPKQETKKQDAKPDTSGKTTLQLKIDGAKDPGELVAMFNKLVEKFGGDPSKKDDLADAYEYIRTLNIDRVTGGFVYEHEGTEKVWDDNDRKWVSEKLNKIAAAMDEPAESSAEPQSDPTGPAEWIAQIDAADKGETLFALISSIATNGQLTADKEAFNAVCDHAFAALDANKHGWESGVVGMLRQHLQARHTTVEMERTHQESNTNG